MTFYDVQGLSLDKGDKVFHPTKFGEGVIATVVGTQAGLGKEGTLEGIPMVFLQIIIPVQTDPAGRTPLVKLNLPGAVQP